MRELIKHILQEQSSKLNLLKVIQDEDIFSAAELVGGMDNLKRIFKDEPEITDIIGSLKGKLDLVYHSRKEYLEFPMEFEIVGKGINNHKTNSWPIINLIYDDSKLSESEKKLFEQFVYDSIGDLNISNVKRNPKILKMFREKGDYMAIDYVNGKDWEGLDHDIRYEDNDMKNLHREYYIKSYMNESKIIDKIKSFFGKNPLTKDDRLINLIVQFIKDNYKMEGEIDKFGTVTIYLTDDTGNLIHPPIMKYYPDNKVLDYSWEFSQDIYGWFNDERLLKLDSEMMGKIFEKLFKKKINVVYGYSRL